MSPTPTAEQREQAAKLWADLGGSYQHVAHDPALFAQVMTKDIDRITAALAAERAAGERAGIEKCVAKLDACRRAEQREIYGSAIYACARRLESLLDPQPNESHETPS
jgi:hypothetical protein